MCGLIGRRCWCEQCRQPSRETRKQRLITSIVFLIALWLVNKMGDPIYQLAAMGVWIVLFVAVEWRYVYAIPLVPAVDSERWKRAKSMLAWGFLALIIATFVFAGVFSAI